MLVDATFPTLAVILAGGKGTRLGLTDRPKPMVLIDHRPLLEIQVEWLRSEGIKEIYFLLNHMAESVQNHFGDGSRYLMKFHYVVESSPLGTSGSLAQLKNQIRQNFWVVYGDLLCDLDLKRMFDFHKKHQSDLSLAVHPNDHPYDSDLVEVNAQSQVTRFLTKPHPEGLQYKNLVNAAVYLASPQLLSYLPEGAVLDLARDIFPKILTQLKVFAYSTTEYLKDMGTPDRLEKVKKDWHSGKVKKMRAGQPRPCVFLDRDGTICEYVHELNQVRDFKLRPHVDEAIRLFNQKGFLVLVVTNQPMIAKAVLTYQGLEDIHKKMETDLGNGRAWLDGIYYCPHHPDKGFPGEIVELKIDCDCRKPKTGMLTQAGRDFSIDLKKTYMVGDTWRDVQCGMNFGIKTVGLSGGGGYPYEEKDKDKKAAHFMTDNLLSAAEWILQQEGLS